MGLFQKTNLKKAINTLQKSHFEAIIIETSNVLKELKDIALANHLNPLEIDFKVLEVKTFFKDEMAKVYEINDINRNLLEKEEFLRNPTIKIFQRYKIEIFQKNLDEISFIPHISLSANKSLTTIMATLFKNKALKVSQIGYEDIIKEINIKKIKAGLLINIADTKMHQEVEKALEWIGMKGSLEEDYTFVVCEGLHEIQSTDDAFIVHYKQKNQEQNDKSYTGKIDYTKRGYIVPVEQNECILEYIKPQMGQYGRNCKGMSIGIKEPKVEHDMPVNISENIIKQEDDKSIKYLAKRSGFVSNNKEMYDIQDEMELQEVTFKSTGSIDANIQSNIKINIKEKDSLKDAIGAGLSVETTQLAVDGNVGSGAKIKAGHVSIAGSTHQSSVIEAEQISIALHHGEARGDEVSIDRLEGGKVIANKAYIKQMSGGEVIAAEIKVEILLSNATLIASDLIEIIELKGHNNKFLIDPSATKAFYAHMSLVGQEITKIEEELKGYPHQLSSKKEFLQKNKPTAEQIKEKVLELKKEGIEPPLTLLVKLKAFQDKVLEYNNLLQLFKDKTNQLNTLKQEQDTIQKKVFNAHIINHSLWKEFNEIRFHLIFPPRDITYYPKESEFSQEITLKDMKEGVYHVHCSNGYEAL